MFKKEELVSNFLQEISTLEKPIEAVIDLLEDFISKYPDELPTINLTIGRLSSIALVKKKEQLREAANSMQYLISVDSIGTKLKKTDAQFRVISFV
jgi:hypothetical protein